MRPFPVRRLLLFVLSVVALGSAAERPCRADLIPITFDPSKPIVNSLDIAGLGSLTYNATTHEFSHTGTLAQLTGTMLAGSPVTITSPPTPPTVSLDLFVDNSGSFLANGTGFLLRGTVTINGTVVAGTTAADPLLAGTITAFGAQGPMPPTWTASALFTATGGELTRPLPAIGGGSIVLFPVGSAGGAILAVENVTSGILGNFAANFSSNRIKDLEGILVPEPPSMTLALLAIVGIAGWHQLWKRGPFRRRSAR
jgi:hypothetical protein